MGDKLLIENLLFDLFLGGIVGVIGLNGVGKLILFKMLIGQEQFDEGIVEYGDIVQLLYVDQFCDDLNVDEIVWEVISGGVELIQLGDVEVNSCVYCLLFNFKGGD